MNEFQNKYFQELIDMVYKNPTKENIKHLQNKVNAWCNKYTNGE